MRLECGVGLALNVNTAPAPSVTGLRPVTVTAGVSLSVTAVVTSLVLPTP